MPYFEPGTKMYRQALISMLLGSLVTFAVLYSPQTLLGVFAEQYHVSPALASLTVSLTTAALAVGMLFAPLLAAAWGRKKVMSLSLLLTSCFAIAASLGHSFPFLLTVRLLTGLSLAGFPALAVAYLGEEFAPDHLGRVTGLYVAGTGLGGFIGRVIIGTLTDLCSWQLALLGLGAASLVCSLWFAFNLPESRPDQRTSLSFPGWTQNLKRALGSRKLLYLYSLGFLLMGAYVALLNYIGFPLRQAPYRLSQTILGSLFVVNLLGLWTSVRAGRFADRYPRGLVLGGAIALMLSGALLTLGGPLLLKIAGLAVLAGGFFAGHAVVCGWVGLTAPAAAKAEAASLYFLFYYAGSSLIGWVGGFSWTRFGWDGVIVLIGLLLGLAAVLTLRAGRIADKRARPRTISGQSEAGVRS